MNKKINNTNNKLFEILHCEDYDYTCKINSNIAQYLLQSPLLYCATINLSLQPYITPVIYAYGMNNCTISFLIPKISEKAKHLRKNPFLSLSMDIIDKKDPSMNTGLMIKAVANFSYSNAEMKQALYNMRKRYTEFDVPEIVDKYLDKSGEKINQTNILVKAKILKIVYWRGPFMIKDLNLICPARQYVNTQKAKFNPDIII